MAANTLVLQPGMVLTISFRWVAGQLAPPEIQLPIPRYAYEYVA